MPVLERSKTFSAERKKSRLANALILDSSTVGCNGKLKPSIVFKLGNLALCKLVSLSVASLAETSS